MDQTEKESRKTRTQFLAAVLKRHKEFFNWCVEVPISALLGNSCLSALGVGLVGRRHRDVRKQLKKIVTATSKRRLKQLADQEKVNDRERYMALKVLSTYILSTGFAAAWNHRHSLPSVLPLCAVSQ